MAISGKVSPVGGAILTGSAPLTFTSAATNAQVDSNIQLLWDFDNDGDFDQPIEDVTSYVLSAESFVGRDSPSNLTGKSGPGKLRLTLDNSDNRFSGFNTASPLNTAPYSLKTGRKVRVRTTDGVLGASLITYVGIGALAAGSNAPVIPALPAGLRAADPAVGQNADLMLVLASIRNSGTGTVDTPAGWANLLTSGNVTLLGRYYQTGDTAPTVSFTGGVANATTLAQCFAFRGCHQTLSHVISASTTQLNGSAQNIAVPALTVSEANNAVVVAGWKQDDWTSVATLAQSLIEIADSPSVTGDDAGHVIDYKIETTATPITATSFTVTGGAAAISRALVFALRPAVDQTDPELLARDRFDRPNASVLGFEELGAQWVVQANGGFSVKDGYASALDDYAKAYRFVDIIETVDVGSTDHYVQASIPHIVQDGRVGLVVRFIDTNNYIRCYYTPASRGIILEDIRAGVPTNLSGTWQIEPWEGMTLGLGVQNQTATLYVGGFPLESFDLTSPLSGTKVGIWGIWQTSSDVAPAFDDFYVYDRPAHDIDGVLWTGYVKTLKTRAAAGALKVAEVECEGPLAAAAVTDIPAPRIGRLNGEHDSGDNHSVPAGALVGDIMARAMLLHPPHPLTGSEISQLGPHAVPDGKALELARRVETAERGFIKETPQGQVAFEDRTYRDSVSSSAWFSDTPGVGQYRYTEVTPLDQQAEIINRASARVGPSQPSLTFTVFASTIDAASLDVFITLSDTKPGQLLLLFVAVSADAAGSEHGCAPPWVAHRRLAQGEGNGMRIYTMVCDGSESGSSWYFYKGSSPGTATTLLYHFDNWYGSDDGIDVGRVSLGTDAYPVTPSWNRAPTMFVLTQVLIGASGSSGAGPFLQPQPVGYDSNTLDGSLTTGLGDALNTGIWSIMKTDVADQENPRAWAGVFKDWLILETVCVAIRGYDGPLTKPTLDNPKAVGGQGLVVTVDDPDSQLDHNFVRSNPDIPDLMYTEADAQDWCEGVIAEHSTDRPIVTLAFWASRSTELRLQAIRGRLSTKIALTATGNAGLGISGEFFVESISHEWSHGTKLWRCLWELSPA